MIRFGAGADDRDFELFQHFEFFEEEGSQFYTRGRIFSEAVTSLCRPSIKERFPKIVIEGAPGQRKSTITQFLCQINRMILLDRRSELDQLPPAYRSIEVACTRFG